MCCVDCVVFCLFFFFCIFFCFFFQAEDGIRDLVRSRGLGDVYKRQDQNRADAYEFCVFYSGFGYRSVWFDAAIEWDYNGIAVSYTHLTLPTSDLV